MNAQIADPGDWEGPVPGFPVTRVRAEAGAGAPLALPAPRAYWQAQPFAERIQHAFAGAQDLGDTREARRLFFILARYAARSLAIVRQAIENRNESLARTGLQNLVALYAPMAAMHQAFPAAVPLALTFDQDLRSRLVEDLINHVLQEAPAPLNLSAIARKVRELDVLSRLPEAAIQRHLDDLAASGHVTAAGGSYRLTGRPYHAIDIDRAVIASLTGPSTYRDLERAGYDTLAAIVGRKRAFATVFAGVTGFGADTAALFVSTAELLARSDEAAAGNTWAHADLIGSSHPRPYQREAYAILRGYGYQGQVIEAPAGSGKTLIGMMCIQDWLRSLAAGECILVLVPTVNYQQQWIEELCHRPTGLRLQPHLVFAGTPAGLEREQWRSGTTPAICVMTYAALAQIGSAVGKGGFDVDSVEAFLQGGNVQHVVLDEVHKVVEDMAGTTARVARVLVEWTWDGSIKGLIGFSGTAAVYRARLAEVGLQLVHVTPGAELIAHGFVAPFGELGVPFAYSDREQRLRDLADAYRAGLHEFLGLVGGSHLRRWFAEIPLADRMRLGRDVLGFTGGRSRQDEAIAIRFRTWEQHEGELALTELPMVSIVQLARGWSDRELVVASAEPNDLDDALDRFARIRERLESLRDGMTALLFVADTRRRLSVAGFGTRLDTEALGHLLAEPAGRTGRADAVRELLAPTMVGVYRVFGEWRHRMGEGRVATIKAIIAAERATRRVPGVIVFDTGKRIRWEQGPAAPGYAGVAGLFGEMLGDPDFTPVAVLSREIYLPFAGSDPPRRIAEYIRRAIMRHDMGESLFDLATRGLAAADGTLGNDDRARLRAGFDAIYGAYLDQLAVVRGARRGEFDRMVLKPFRRAVLRSKLVGPSGSRLADLSPRRPYLRRWLETFSNYNKIAGAFENAHVATLEQVSGATRQFYVVKMPASHERKQLLYDLTARIVDAEELGINMIIVSPWARTGWNVITPNVLIDATATRDPIAWQQLRGRAMRPMATWNADCYRALTSLLEPHHQASTGLESLPDDVAEALRDLDATGPATNASDATSLALLRDAHQQVRDRSGEADLANRLADGDLPQLDAAQRQQLATELLLARNKVTHIYELVRASGRSPQIRFHRAQRRWQRAELLAAKHAHELAVNPLTGEYGPGDAHAPLCYVGDPRQDMPSDLRAHLTSALSDADTRIVRGWVATVSAERKADTQVRP